VCPKKELENDTNGVYRVDPSYVRIGTVSGWLGLILFSGFGIAMFKESLGLAFAFGLFSALFIWFLIQVRQAARRSLQVSDQGVSVSQQDGTPIGAITWSELSKVNERRAMQQLVLRDSSGNPRVLIDYQYEYFYALRERVFAECARNFILKPLPILLNRAGTALGLLIPAALLGLPLWMIFMRDRHKHTPNPVSWVILIGFGIWVLLELNHQLGGPSEILEDRLVLRSVFKSLEIFKKDITAVDIIEVANRGNVSLLIRLEIVGRQPLTIGGRYGDIPEIYLTLRKWLGTD
jgi:hypothetical protein